MPVPTDWADPPTTWSPSSLHAVEACPRRWQFLASRWGEHDRFPERLHPAAVEGRIVHEALERLGKELGSRGRPPIGSPSFREAVVESGFFELFASELVRWDAAVTADRPIASSRRLRVTPMELANRAVRALRATYHPGDGVALEIDPATRRSGSRSTLTDGASLLKALRARGVLTEITVRHPTLPFLGVIDQAMNHADGIRIVDFKTGSQKPEHLDQVHAYAVAWWRSTGVPPGSAVLQYPGSPIDVALDERTLESFERRLESRIDAAREALRARPAPCIPSEACRHCGVRARCDEGWGIVATHDPGVGPAGSIDLELEVLQAPSATGFVGMAATHEVHVAYEPAVGRALPTMHVGEHVRLSSATRRSDGAIEIGVWTELHIRPVALPS